LDKETYDRIIRYKKELEVLGYEVEVLFYVDAKEIPNYILGSYFSHDDLDKNLIPHTPKPDRFIKKKFDLLLNLYFQDSFPVNSIAKKSHAKCRVGAYRNYLKECSDLFVYTDEENNLEELITQIDITLKKQAYERKIY
jgi:hypothetical protein